MSGWPPRADDVYKCLYKILSQCTQCNWLPVAICESICLKLDTRKEVTQLWGSPGIGESANHLGICIMAGTSISSSPIEMEDVSEIAFTMQRFAGHCGLLVTAYLESSPDGMNWDSCGYAGFTNVIFGAGIAQIGQCTLPITTGPKYMRAEIENESMNDITIRAWLTLTKTCG